MWAWHVLLADCLQKLASTPENLIPLAGNIKPYISTTLAWDNVDRLEELCQVKESRTVLTESLYRLDNLALISLV